MPQETRRAQPATGVCPADEHAHLVADMVTKAWHGAFATDRLDIPLSVIATLAAIPAKDELGNDHTPILLEKWNAHEFALFSRSTWTTIIRARPEITHLIYPLVAWMFTDDATDPNLDDHAFTVARAALQSRQLELTGTIRRYDTDLLGITLMTLRTGSSAKSRGQYYTPSDVAEILATHSRVEKESSIIDPQLGTGSLFRGAAARLRKQGRNPEGMQWVGCDLDSIAVACATVNSMIWGLGRNILFHVGNSFHDWYDEACTIRAELLDAAKYINNVNRAMKFMRELEN